MDLSIIIVSWNVQEKLRVCLGSILNSGTKTKVSYEIIVVDNASADKTVGMVLNEFSQAHLIANGDNKGFATAVNQAAQVSQGDYILLLNPDTIIKDTSLDELLARARSLNNLGVLGGQLSNIDGSLQPSVRGFPTLGTMILIVTKLQYFFPQVLNRYYARAIDYSKEQEVDQVMGSYFLVPRPVWVQLKGMDPNFFVWFEEVDFCYRAKQAGFKIIYTPLGGVIHEGGESFVQLATAKRQLMYNRSLRYYLRKRQRYFSFVIILLLQPVSLIIAYLSQFLTFLKIRKPV